MNKTKHPLQSKTIVFASLGFLLQLAMFYGYVTELEAQGILDALEGLWPHVVVMVTTLGAIYGRFVATTKLKL